MQYTPAGKTADMLTKHRALIFIWLIDCAVTVAVYGRCDNYVTPKAAALGLSVALLFAYIVCGALLSGDRPRLRPSFSGLLLLLWLSANAASAAASHNPAYSLGEMNLTILFVLVYFAIKWIPENAEFPEHFSVAAPAVFGFVFAAHGILQFFGMDIFSNWSRYSNSGSRALGVISLFGNSNLLADFLAIVFPLAIAMIFFAPVKKNNRLFTICGAAAIFVAIILTGSRAALLAAFCGAVVLSAGAVSSGNKKSRIPAYVAAFVITAGLIAASTFYVPGKKSSMPMRFVYWKAAVEMFEKKPALGGGPGHFKLEYLNFQREYFKGPHPVESERIALIEKPGHPHNEYLNALADTGVIGFLFLVLTLGAGIYLGLKLAARGAPFGAAWAASIVSFSAVSFFSFPLRIPTTGILLPVALAFLDGAPHDDSPAANNRVPLPSILRGTFVKYFVFAAVLFIAAFSIYKIFVPLEARMFLTNAKRYLGMNQPDYALNQSQKALKLYPADGEMLTMEGVIYLATGRAGKAIPYLIKAQRTSGDPSLYYNLSLAYSETGDIKSAAEYMEYYSQAIPGDMRAKMFLAGYYYRTNRTDAALEEIAKARRLAKDDKAIQQITQFETLIRQGRKSIK
jgi:O-antigen ligase